MKKVFLIILSIFLSTHLTLAQEKFISPEVFSQRVLDYSIQIKQSKLDSESSRKMTEAIRSSLLPFIELSATGQYKIGDNSMNFAGTPLDMPRESYGIDVNVIQNIYNGRKIYNSLKANQIMEEVAKTAELLTVENVLYSSQIAYWNSSAKKSLYWMNSRYYKINQELEAVLKERFDEGLISITDLLQVQARLKEAEFGMLESKKSYSISLQNMNVMMGLDPYYNTELSDITQLEPITTPDDIDDIPLNRPEYLISKLNTKYLERELKITQAEYSPSFSVGIKESWGTSALNFDGKKDFRTTAFASLNIPIFHWGARYKKVASKRALITKSELEGKKIIDNILSNITNSTASFQISQQQIIIAKKAQEIALENLEINIFSYKEGKVPIIDVLTAQVSWLQSYSNYIKAELQLRIAYSDYIKASGILLEYISL